MPLQSGLMKNFRLLLNEIFLTQEFELNLHNFLQHNITTHNEVFK